MNLIHGFFSTNPLINPDMVLMQRGTYAHQLKRLFTDSKLRVGHLYEMKTTASSSVKFGVHSLLILMRLLTKPKKATRRLILNINF